MASLRRRGRVWWIRYYVGRKLIEKSLRTPRKDEALRQLKEHAARDVLGELRTPSRTPVDTFLETFIARIKRRSPYKAGKIDEGRIRGFFRRANVKTLEQVTPALLSRVLETWLRDGRSPATYNMYRSIVHRAFAYAILELGFVSPELGRVNPAKFVRRIKVGAPRIVYLSLAEIDDLLAHLASDAKLQSAVATLIYTGVRRSELLWLTVADLDLDAGLVMIRGKTIGDDTWDPKTRKNRSIPISDTLREYLARWMRTRPDSTWLFPAPRGERWDPDNFSTSLRRAQAGREKRWGCLHTRHSFASHLARKGISLFKIAKLLGNTTGICERHYAHLSPAGLAEEVEFRKPVPPAAPVPSVLRIQERPEGWERFRAYGSH